MIASLSLGEALYRVAHLLHAHRLLLLLSLPLLDGAELEAVVGFHIGLMIVHRAARMMGIAASTPINDSSGISITAEPSSE